MRKRPLRSGSAAIIGKDPGLVNTELDHYLKVTPADINAPRRIIFVAQHATVLIVTPAPPAQWTRRAARMIVARQN